MRALTLQRGFQNKKLQQENIKLLIPDIK